MQKGEKNQRHHDAHHLNIRLVLRPEADISQLPISQERQRLPEMDSEKIFRFSSGERIRGKRCRFLLLPASGELNA